MSKCKYKTNWKAYNEGLKQPGSITVWVRNDLLEQWRHGAECGYVEQLNLVEVEQEVQQLIPQLKRQTGILQNLQKQFDEVTKSVNTSNEERLERLYIDKGFAEGEILQYRTMLEQAEYYQSLVGEKNNLEAEDESIRAYIFKTETAQNDLKKKISAKIKEEAVYLLTNDLERQDEFITANDFHVDFSNNIAYLSSKHAKYSASSNFYLKITARFAIFLSSLSIPEMRYPRFILADNMEDKGIEEIRAQNFQKILIQRLAQYSSQEYQVIFTTSYITNELNKSDLVVGDFYTKGTKTLKNV